MDNCTICICSCKSQEAVFDSCQVQGRSFSVHIHYLEEPVEDYTRAAVSTCLQIHQIVRVAMYDNCGGL